MAMWYRQFSRMWNHRWLRYTWHEFCGFICTTAKPDLNCEIRTALTVRHRPDDCMKIVQRRALVFDHILILHRL